MLVSAVAWHAAHALHLCIVSGSAWALEPVSALPGGGFFASCAAVAWAW